MSLPLRIRSAIRVFVLPYILTHSAFAETQIEPCSDLDCERAVLTALYQATDGANWRNNENWLSDEPVFKWHGIGPSADGRRIGSISLIYNGLRGHLPPELGQLSGLAILSLRLNELTGAIPPELGQLAGLVDLELSYNGLDGPIPPELGSLSKLSAIRIESNRLSGEIPSEFLKLELSVFRWSSNRDLCMPDTPEFEAWIAQIRHYWGGAFCGAEGDPLDRYALVALYHATDGANWHNNENWLSDKSVFKWHGIGTSADGRRIGSISLSDNGLRGHLPPELGQLSGLASLSLRRNELTGSIPPELGQLGDLDYLGLSYNDFDGPIPPELGSLSKLTELYLGSNRLSGEIPMEFLELDLYGFEWSGNRDLCMPDTPEFEAWIARISSYLGGYFCGAGKNLIDREVLVTLYRTTDGANWLNNENWLSDEPVFKWHGIGPSADGRRIGSISLGNNGLRGHLPPELGQLAGLETLNFYANELTGPVPPELGQLGDLDYLGLSYNDFDGPIPPELGSLSKLTELYLGSNRLSGEIPTEFLKLDLYGFEWSGNRDLCMPDTAEFEAWTSRTSLHHSGGNFCGHRDKFVLDILFEKTGGKT